MIGRGGQLPWHLADDLKRFKRLTMGHTIVMGRKTWESIGRPLPGRRSIVVTRQNNYQVGFDEVAVVGSITAALECAIAAGDDEVFIIGGAELFRETLSQADRFGQMERAVGAWGWSGPSLVGVDLLDDSLDLDRLVKQRHSKLSSRIAIRSV